MAFGHQIYSGQKGPSGIDHAVAITEGITFPDVTSPPTLEALAAAAEQFEAHAEKITRRLASIADRLVGGPIGGETKEKDAIFPNALLPRLDFLQAKLKTNLCLIDDGCDRIERALFPTPR